MKRKYIPGAELRIYKTPAVTIQKFRKYCEKNGLQMQHVLKVLLENFVEKVEAGVDPLQRKIQHGSE